MKNLLPATRADSATDVNLVGISARVFERLAAVGGIRLLLFGSVLLLNFTCALHT